MTHSYYVDLSHLGCLVWRLPAANLTDAGGIKSFDSDSVLTLPTEELDEGIWFFVEVNGTLDAKRRQYLADFWVKTAQRFLRERSRSGQARSLMLDLFANIGLDRVPVSRRPAVLGKRKNVYLFLQPAR